MAIGVVGYAIPVGVLPWHLAQGFTRQQAYPILRNVYRNGETQARRLAATSRSIWAYSSRLTAEQMAVLQQFYIDHKGPMIPFTFYDVRETDPMFSYDDTGTEATGRYTVRFDGPLDWTVGVGMLRANAAIRLVQLSAEF